MQKRLEFQRVESNLRLPCGFVRQGSDRPVMPRPVGESHRLAGAWAYDHGVTVYLNLEREHSRSSADDCLGFVILCRPVRPAGVGHTSGCVNLEFARISTTKYTGALACENASLPWKAKPASPKGAARSSGRTWSDSVRGITLRLGGPQRSLLRQQRTLAIL